MHLAVFLPYLIIGFGLALGQARLRPAMRPWGICMIGALSGPVIMTALIAVDQMPSWYLIGSSVAPFAVVFIMVVRDLSYPPINDVTTDTCNPPLFTAALRSAGNKGRDMTYPQSFKSKARKAFPSIRSLKLNEPADRIFDKIVDVANRQRGWRVHYTDAAKRTMEAEAVTPFLGFADDIVIQVTEQEGMTQVDMRSKSREGLVDAGTNAKRIAGFLEGLRQSGAGDPENANLLPTTITKGGALS
ncbi:DUF1499 domain-containing protein [uncultured Roseobacter sp.]|uniref:DUF1499 domain-containing protein n=1 Tax=uncultured Roseobacter sp. TaxID=114847 RepID=UPI0026077A10|nr:DUF1499 domain-containing protein [uncultured Roseobacter sp.]